jgi:hypothetical protein
MLCDKCSSLSLSKKAERFVATTVTNLLTPTIYYIQLIRSSVPGTAARKRRLEMIYIDFFRCEIKPSCLGDFTIAGLFLNSMYLFQSRDIITHVGEGDSTIKSHPFARHGPGVPFRNPK